VSTAEIAVANAVVVVAEAAAAVPAAAIGIAAATVVVNAVVNAVVVVAAAIGIAVATVAVTVEIAALRIAALRIAVANAPLSVAVIAAIVGNVLLSAHPNTAGANLPSAENAPILVATVASDLIAKPAKSRGRIEAQSKPLFGLASSVWPERGLSGPRHLPTPLAFRRFPTCLKRCGWCRTQPRSANDPCAH